MSNTPSPSRRDVLRTSGFALSTALVAGCLSSADPAPSTAETPPDVDVTVDVGPDGHLVFEPSRVEVRPGATVRWAWRSDDHNVVVGSQPDDAGWTGSPGSRSTLRDDGFDFAHTFDAVGAYEYYCQPHRAAGMTGEVVVTESPDGTETPGREPHAEPADETETSSGARSVADRSGLDEVTIEVGPGGRLEFDPEVTTVSRDATVRWVWRSDTHNVVAGDVPAGASWEGTPGGGSTTYDRGHAYEETFSVTGRYDYWCQPHRSAGMVGRILVE